MTTSACTALTLRHLFRYGHQDFELALDARGAVELRQAAATPRAGHIALEPMDLVAVGRGEFATPIAIVEAALDSAALGRTGRYLAERFLAACAAPDFALAA